MSAESKPASAITAAANRADLSRLPFADDPSQDDARRGFIATLDPPVITGADGQVVWDLRNYDFLDGEATGTVNPSLWRMARLNLNHGLFRVIDGIYQVRGFDLSNMTVIEGETGYVVVDPLLSAEAAAAAMGLVREHLGDKPITAVVVTHSHSDHFGGIKGIVSADEVASGAVRVVAPTGFLEHAISENVYAGIAMSRRAQYMYGVGIPPGPLGQVSTGLGVSLSNGTTTLLAPTDLVSESGTELVLDGLRFAFQYTPGAEAPAEMNFHLPDLRALCMAENVSHTMHNLYTLRGAEIRDAAAWSDYIHEALELFGDESDVMFIGHHWPVWGRENIEEFLERQRDLYRYVHDETLRLAAHGHTMVEIAEKVELPENLATFWANRGYYGALNHNVKAVYQKYLGWFDGNPANLHPHGPVEAGERYLEFMGGSEAVLEKARRSFDDGDYRWVAQVVKHVVFAEPDNRAARELQADALEQLGYQAESAPWRNFYLTGALELRTGALRLPTTSVTEDVLGAMTTDMLLSYLAIRLNGPKAAHEDLRLLFEVTDTDELRFVHVANGVLVRSSRVPSDGYDATVRLDRTVLAALALGTRDPADDMDISGDSEAVHVLFGLCDRFRPDFPIVTP
ncbi:MBL fold metallo-hydrolase [Saccharopolyspora karakumensis]|uniref:Linear primary-alkylsulfatase n=1 Tax=Saccharopolyspora karakumensis TaxID=2530386 RepID=A0A4R5BWL9_9PSEU|nr:alkyl sulfatase dimerization domain-containing protein [Saccharopolyspora karakumensis]TDD90615.1 MBL fold metallo-hydrolase [Saccharopolyspora karakumensis]